MGTKPERDETVDTLKALEGKKQIGIYFSAHWCPPCRGFTPILTKRYEDLQEVGFEIVFASSDKDRAACKEYFEKEMGSWLTLPFEDRDLKDMISKKFKVQGIPTLVILNAKGEFVSSKGRSFITETVDFPFQAPTFHSALGKKLVKKVNGQVKEIAAVDALKGKQVALYFSAHWCPPCRGFTPELAKLYNSMKQRVADGKREDDFEFVFVSSDKDQASFSEYFGEMPWLAQPFSNRAGKAQLSDMFDVRGIPCLITLDADGTIINKSARGAASEDTEGLNFPWLPKAVNDVNSVTDGLNDEVCVIVLLDGADPADVTARKKDLEAVAKKYYDAARSSKTDPPYRFFYEDKKGNISGQIRSLTSSGDGAKTIILDLGDEGSYYTAGKEGDVEGLLTAFKNKELTKKQVKQ